MKGAISRLFDGSQWAQALFSFCTVLGLISIVFGVAEMVMGKDDLARWDILTGIGIWLIPAVILGIYWQRSSPDDQ